MELLTLDQLLDASITAVVVSAFVAIVTQWAKVLRVKTEVLLVSIVMGVAFIYSILYYFAPEFLQTLVKIAVTAFTGSVSLYEIIKRFKKE